MFFSSPKAAPGPPKIPLIGNIHHVGLKRQWEAAAKYSQTCNSDVIQLEGFGVCLLCLNSHQSAVDLLDARSSIYSSRPNLLLPNDLKKIVENGFALLPYGERWMKARQMVTKHLRVETTSKIQNAELQALHAYLKRVLEAPQDCAALTKEFFHENSLLLLYGIKAPHVTAQVSHGFDQVRTYAPKVFGLGSILTLITPSSIKKVLPGFAQSRAVTAIQESVVPLKDTPFNESYAAWRAGSYEPSMVTNALDSSHTSPLSEEDLKILSEAAATSLFSFTAFGGPTFTVFFLAMALHPDAQKAAQTELDNVLGGRLPTHADLRSLPYITAIYREILRWLPVLPFGVAHLAMEDDYYRDYFIRKNTIVVANQWAMFRDESHYPDAASFKPDRYLKDGLLNPDVLDPCKIAFGRGGRVCPGRDLIESTIKIAMASFLTIFNIQKAVDDNGNVIEPNIPYCEHPHFDPPAFPAKLTVRSTEAAQSLRNTQ